MKLAAISLWRVIRSGALFKSGREWARVWARARWLLIRYLGVGELVLPFEGLRIIVRTTDYAIGCQVFVDGHFSRPEFQRALELLTNAGLFRGSAPVFVDIGANIGTHTLHALASRKFARVVSIEPEAENFAQLLRNLRINRFATDDAINAAVSSTPGRGLLALSAENFGDHRVVRDPQASAGSATETIELVDFATISSRLGLDSQAVTLFWIDTQGHEFEVLSGIGAERLRRSPFVIEFWPIELRANGTLDALVALLRGVTSRLVVLQDGRELAPHAELAALIEGLLHKPRNEGAVDLLCFGDLL